MNKHQRTLITTLLLSAFCAVLAPRTAAHTFHTSLMSIEYNHREQLVEISVQVFSHDLENILTRRNRRNVRLGKTPDAEALTFDYLQQAINIKNAAGEAKALSWVGMETKSNAVWLYVEAKMPEGLDGAQLRNRIFFDLLDDQVNLVHLKDEDKKSDLVFKPGDNFKPLWANEKKAAH
ncbi:MAG TPA: DUF6702 family protein [Pyrinomonadaceae bacterium]|jgi:hypothetical protein